MLDSTVAHFPIVRHFSTHEFSSLGTAPFDVSEYSKMKFGSNKSAKKLGYEMADSFFQENYNVLLDPCVVIPAPSTSVSVAATLIARHFTNRLNSLLIQKGLPILKVSSAYREIVYNQNYAELPKEGRKELLKNNEIFFNRDFLSGKTLIFVDDTTITGSHEEMIKECLRAQHMTNDIVFVSYCKYNGDDPSIESRLNRACVKSAEDLALLSHETGYVTTVRAIRMLLESKEDLNFALDVGTHDFANTAYYGAITKGYNEYPEYKESFKELEKFVFSTDI